MTVSASSVQEKAFNMSYLYFGNPASYVSIVDQAQGSIDEISPNYFELNSNGSLKDSINIDKGFVQQMHNRTIKVVPFLSNHWNQDLGIAALHNRELLTDQIAAAVQEYDLDGIHIDLENLTHAERQNYYELVKLLREKIPKEKTLAVAVAANPYAYTTGWQGSYDYEKLASVADYIMIMAYDEHYEGSRPGPVASLDFAKKSIMYALRYAPAEKIVLGVPFYGRIWGDSGKPPYGQGVSDAQIQVLIQAYHGVVTYDDVSQAAVAQIKIPSNSKKPTVGGKTLTEGTYFIWYENESSKKELLTLVKEYKLKGTGSWSLGQETKQTWDYYSLWLNGFYFVDVQGHWAMQDILSSARSGIMNGVSASSFAPDRSLTRAETAVILVRMLRLPAAPTETSAFSDTSLHWAKQEIASAQYSGLLNGRGDNLFYPDSPISRQEMAVLLDRAISSQTYLPSPKSPFTDVSSNDQTSWSYDAILHLSEAGILQGYPDGTFRPNDLLTRAQMTAIINKMTNKK